MNWTLSGNTVTINIAGSVGTTQVSGTVVMKNVYINSSNQLVGTVTNGFGDEQTFTGTYTN